MNNSAKKENISIDDVIKGYGKNIRNIIMSVTGNRHFQDIQQEVYIKIWKNLPKYKDNGKFSGWIKKVTVNTCKDHLKSRQYNQEAKTDYEENNIISMQDKKITPDNLILLNERRKKIINSIEKLSPKLKEVIIFYDIKEMSYEEIARKTNCPVGTVKSRLFNARKQLQAELKDLID